MKTLTLLCSFVLVCAQGTLKAANETNSVAQTKQEKIQRVMQATGAHQIAHQVASQVIGQMREVRPDLPNEFWDEFVSGKNLNELSNTASSIYEKSFSEEEVSQLLAFYESPVGQKISKLQPDLTRKMMDAGQKWSVGITEKVAHKIRSIQELQINLLKAQAERRHWTEQLENIRAGKQWFGLEGYDKNWRLILTDPRPFTAESKAEAQKSLDDITRLEAGISVQLAELGCRPTTASASDASAFISKVKSDKDDVVILENGGIVKIRSGYLGYIGYRKDAVLFKSGRDWRIWISGKKAFKCDLIDAPVGKGVPAQSTSIRQVKGNGSIIETDEGSIYQVDRLNTVTTSGWFAMTEVLILNESRMLDLSSGGEIVEVTKLK